MVGSITPAPRKSRDGRGTHGVGCTGGLKDQATRQKDGDIIVFHAYDGKTGEPFLQVSTLAWKDGWPKAALEGGNPAE